MLLYPVQKLGDVFCSGELFGKKIIKFSLACNVDKEEKNSYHRDEEISSTSFFHKSYPLSPTVTLSMSIEVLLAVEYKIPDICHFKYYLASKIKDEEES